MDVTRTNFNDVLPQVEEAIKKATFLTIDGEFTGLNVVTDINAIDSIELYYEKVRRNSRDFLVIQYGLSAFRFDETAETFKHQSFNFYIFRKPGNKNIPDQRFLCQSSSIDFLISHDFDFNKLFREGISYLNIDEQEKYKSFLEDQQKTRANTLQQTSKTENENRICISESDQPFIDKVLKQVEDFVTEDKEEINLPVCNAFLRRLIYQEVQLKFPDKVSLRTKKIDGKHVQVLGRPKSQTEKESDEKSRVEEEMKEFDDAVGFSKVLKSVVDSGKLIIGHNICLDLLHTIDKFLTPLPENYTDFKECAHSLFPKILDTKYMANCDVFKDLIPSTVLGHITEAVSKKPFKRPPIDVEEGAAGYSIDDSCEHEAGYDSFITGVNFLTLWRYLGIKKSLSLKDNFRDFRLLQPFLNRIFLMKLLDAPYMHLGGRDPVLSREHVFHLTFPKEWKLSGIMGLFSPFGNIYVSWITDSSAFICLYRKDLASVALSTLSQSDTYTILPYERYMQNQQASAKLPLPSPHRKRRHEIVSKETKKRKTSSYSEGISLTSSIEPIAEENEEDSDEQITNAEENGSKKKNEEISDDIDVGELVDRNEYTKVKYDTRQKKTDKRTISKMFTESDSWE